MLGATPTDEAEISRLVDEIKSRAKNSIKYGNFPEAITLYTKAIELLPSNAILHANRSMCHLTIGSVSEAVCDGQKAVELDSTYAKAYYRLGAAHLMAKSYADAKNFLEKGLELAPGM